MGYIEELRKLVGHSPVILNSAGVIITEDTDKVLLSYRTDTKDWGLPGGYMEIGETLEETAVRELQEEMSIEITDLRLYNIFSGPDFYHTYPNGDQVYSVIAIYLVSNFKGEITVDNDEIQTYKYFHLTSLPEKMTKTTTKIMEAFKRHKT